MPEPLDGLISFFASHHAIRAEKTLHNAGMMSQLIPGPKELSPNCGVALRFVLAQRDQALALLADSKVKIDGVCPYRPATESWHRPPHRRSTRRLPEGDRA
jgi:hypothetical protein